MTEVRTPGSYVRDARAEAGLRQVELAAKSGLSQAHVSQIESGAKPLSVRAAVCFERAMSLPPDSLVRWSPELPATLRERVTSAMPGYLSRLVCRVIPSPPAFA